MDSLGLLSDVLETLRNVCLPSAAHAQAIISAGGVFAIASLASNGRALQQQNKFVRSRSGEHAAPYDEMMNGSNNHHNHNDPYQNNQHQHGGQHGGKKFDLVLLATEALGAVARHKQCRRAVLDCEIATPAMMELLVAAAPDIRRQQHLQQQQQQGGGASSHHDALEPAVAAAIDTLELLISDAEHPSIRSAVNGAGCQGLAVVLADLLSHADKRVREKAARLLYFAAAASAHGGALWQALERSGHTAAIVAVLATAAYVLLERAKKRTNLWID